MITLVNGTYEADDGSTQVTIITCEADENIDVMQTILDVAKEYCRAREKRDGRSLTPCNFHDIVEFTYDIDFTDMLARRGMRVLNNPPVDVIAIPADDILFS